MKQMTEGRKMWVSVMSIFIVFAVTFIVFDDYDRKSMPLDEAGERHLLIFALIVMAGLGWLLYGYAKRMDERIIRQQEEKNSQLRRELTQNIAHELKTPVACILGYTDTIMENPDISEQTLLQFVSRTNAQARRLSALLQDLSTLNKMDYAPEQLSKERVDVSALVADIVLETEKRLASRQMTFRNCLPNDICIHGNWQLLYSIFRNLTDNAVAYAGNGTCIQLSAEHREDSWHFTFSDNGVGVDAKHLPRLFERFYRIDKGRSRDMGGTGLGLAIVKNAVAMHGGQITVSNNSGGGLRFDFSIRE